MISHIEHPVKDAKEGDDGQLQQPTTQMQDVHMAARYGSADTVQRLIVEIGQSATSRRGSVGSTPAHDAAATGNLDTMTWLLTEAGDTPNRAGATVAHVLARHGHTAGLDWLVGTASGSAALSVCTRRRATPLHYASAGGHLGTVQLIVHHLKRLADATAHDTVSTMTKRESKMACQCARCNMDKFINGQVDSGATAVYLACQEGHLDVARHLVTEATASLKLRTYDGMTCVHAAAQMGHLHVLRWLMTTELKNGINDRDFEGMSPLHYAAARGHGHVVTWLLDNGARFVIDKMGGNALHMAAAHGKLEVVRRLMMKGIDRDVIDCDHMTAAMLATVSEHEHCAQLIIEWSRFKQYKEPVHIVPEIIRSEENDVDLVVRDVIEWPDPPPPLSATSIGDGNMLHNFTTTSAPGRTAGTSMLSATVQLKVTTADTSDDVARNRSVSIDASVSEGRTNVTKSTEAAPPPPPPLSPLLTPGVGRASATSGISRTVSMSATIGAQLESSSRWTPMHATASSRTEYQLRSSRSSSDLMAELKAHFGSGGALTLRHVDSRRPGSSAVYSASGRKIQQQHQKKETR